MNKWIKYSLILFFCIDFIIAFTNDSHNLFVLLNISDTISLDSFKNASLGSFFFIHTAVSYLSLIIGFILIITSLFKKFRDYGDFIPFLVVFISLFLGIGTNIIHLSVRTLPIDPSLITIIGLTSVLYCVFYMRDIKLILGINRNHFILDNLREKFIITDEHNYIVETSKSFKTLFNIGEEERLTFDDLKERLSSKIVFYDDSTKFDFEVDRSKQYYNMLIKDINLPFYKHSGTFYLFFDETNSLHYMHDINYIKSHDLMTDIYNRNYLEELRDQLDDSEVKYEVLFFDLDGLKIINDLLGHDAGDELLKKFSKQLKAHLSKDIYPIRLGGDEFVILSTNENNNLKDILNQLIETNKKLPFVEAVHFSYSFAKRANISETLRDVLSRADEGLYKMKESKSNYKDELTMKIKQNQS
jgi:diguanylate cyclase (GGDEF)-like protein